MLIMDFAVQETEELEFREEERNVIVHVTGEVRYSGIINLTEGERIADAIERAGGTTSNADLSRVNLAYMLSDGQRLYIPNVDTDEEYQNEILTDINGEDIVVGGNNERGALININRATQTELETLTGVGPSTALRIIEHRRTNGNFRRIEDIKEVSGIGEARFEAIKNNITI
ncbi:MAG: helix-hairpin-helix domain-containing protein [Oscillospiraceae bacterium]|nr:helix-hairpin-helix domain-containing protein [Oscillospiraceae bacterium]